MPAVEVGTRSVCATSKPVVTCDTKAYSIIKEAEVETTMNIDPHVAAADLRALADQIEQASAIDSFDGEVRLEGRVRLSATRFASDTGSSILQALENKLWLTERPLFGSMGAR